ncbi:MAG TPA: glycogen-binding domain-containing protein [Opitutaceae bacterium]|nr:glycogen-binding domain-containing protein [Opitutaceae bacterium]
MNEPRIQRSKKGRIQTAAKHFETDGAKPQSVDFSCHAPEAQAVCVAGSFNDWSVDKFPLARQPDGHWRAATPLPPGHHEFKFVVDGQWCCEADREPEYRGCPECVPNGFGTMNRVLEVR